MTADEFLELYETSVAVVENETTTEAKYGYAGHTVIRRPSDGTLWMAYWTKENDDRHSFYDDGGLRDDEIVQVESYEKTVTAYRPVTK